MIKFLNRLRNDAKQIHKSCTELVIYAQGSINWSEVWVMNFEDRNVAIKVLNDYYAKKAGKDSTEYL